MSGTEPRLDKSSILQELREVRDRLLKSIAALFVTTVASIFLVAPRLLRIVVAPMGDNQPVALRPTETIVVYFKLALVAGLVLAMPVILFQVLRFVMPALYPNEKVYVYWALLGGTVFFAGGVAFATFVMLPAALPFLQGFLSDIVKPTYSIEEYVSFVTSLLLWVGIVFELPVLMFFLARLGVIKPQGLVKFRKFAIVLAAVLAAAVTPTVDPFNMLLVMAPIILLYEVGILLARLASRMRRRAGEERRRALES
jgi:sec-independent protein translocase protein TatC